jgi:hypothetical protein
VEFRALPRHDTFCIRIHEAFHEEQVFNRRHAISKEEGEDGGSSCSNEELKNGFCRRLNLIENK